MTHESKIVLIVGPSGVGKSSIIREIIKTDGSFYYISPYTTRELRENEKDKIHIPESQMNKMYKAGKFLIVNEVYGIKYGTPIDPIIKRLGDNLYPILDWPINKKAVVERKFEGRVLTVYLMPPSMMELKQRLESDGRDKSGRRFHEAMIEIENVNAGLYDTDIDYKIISENGLIKTLANDIIKITYGSTS